MSYEETIEKMAAEILSIADIDCAFTVDNSGGITLITNGDVNTYKLFNLLRSGITADLKSLQEMVNQAAAGS